MATALTLASAVFVGGLFWAFWRGAHGIPGYTDEWSDGEEKERP